MKDTTACVRPPCVHLNWSAVVSNSGCLSNRVRSPTCYRCCDQDSTCLNLGGPREESISFYAQLHPHVFGAWPWYHCIDMILVPLHEKYTHTKNKRHFRKWKDDKCEHVSWFVRAHMRTQRPNTSSVAWGADETFLHSSFIKPNQPGSPLPRLACRLWGWSPRTLEIKLNIIV